MIGSFLIGLKNPPSKAVYWMPVVYYNSQTYYPEYAQTLTLATLYYCPLQAGEGISVDFRCIVYDNYDVKLDSQDLYEVEVKDGRTYHYNWASNKFDGAGISKGLVIGGLIALVTIMVICSRTKS